MSGKMDAMAYTTMLESTLEQFIDKYYPQGLVLQQDGAPAHRANTKLDYLFDIDVPVSP